MGTGLSTTRIRRRKCLVLPTCKFLKELGELTYMTIDKEIRQGISPQDSAILKLARNQVELDELIEAREFLEALEKANREDGYKGSR